MNDVNSCTENSPTQANTEVEPKLRSIQTQRSGGCSVDTSAQTLALMGKFHVYEPDEIRVCQPR